MRVLVTGGAGFIGSHLSEALVQRGDEVWILDDLSTGRLANVASLQDSPGCHLVIDSILNHDRVDELVESVDIVYHLAAAVGVKYIVDNPLRSLITNVQGTEIVLAAAAHHKTKTVLFSTSEVYGRGNGHPLKETDDRVMGPTAISRWGYATSKALDEFLAFAYHREMDLPVVIVRCFNTCGPRQSGEYGMVIPRFITQALKGEPILVYGDGKQSRCFSSVEDVVRGVLMLADSPRADGQVFNVGSDEEISVLGLAQKILEITGSASLVTMVPYVDAFPTGFEDMRRRVPNLSRINETVGYTPEISLESLLRLTVEHIRTELSGSAVASLASAKA